MRANKNKVIYKHYLTILVYKGESWLNIKYNINELSWEPIAAIRPMICNRI